MDAKTPQHTLSTHDTELLKQVEQRVLWLSHWMIHHANYLRLSDDEIKTGGHQASCASIASILTALYCTALKPDDRVAVKPHAAPIYHAMQYLAGNLNVEKMKKFRGYGGVQAYPSRTKDTDDVDFSTGSVGLGVAITSFASLIQEYITCKPWGESLQKGRMVALMGDAELDEGNVYECLQEGWKHDLRDVWWVIDYNRQSLDGIIHEGLWERSEKIFTAFGWQVLRIKYGRLQRTAFAEPGGNKLREWIDACPNQDYSALTYKGGAAWRKRLLQDLGDQGDICHLLDRRCDKELSALMENLGGNCVSTLAEAFANIEHEQPICFLAYTIKGWGTPLAGHKDNHGGLMTPTQMSDWQQMMGVREGHEWDPFEGLPNATELEEFIKNCPFFAAGNRRRVDQTLGHPELAPPPDRRISTQLAFGKILDSLARTDCPLSERIITMSPDVSGTTSLGPWINRKKLFARKHQEDVFRKQAIPSTAKWEFAPEGQHLELGIAEMNLFLALAAAGLSHSLFGKRLFPIGTVYDPFVSRGLDALNYACYQDARFIIVGTPSGITLAPEGGAHQSVGTPLIGMSQDGLASFEPAFADELAVILNWSFDYLQRDETPKDHSTNLKRDQTGGSVYLRLTTNPLEQPVRILSSKLKKDIIAGGYWWRTPGPNCELVIAYQGAVAEQALAAAGQLTELRRDIGVLAVTSADRLNEGWNAAKNYRSNDGSKIVSHVETLLADVPHQALLLTVIDGHPATLSWLAGVKGTRAISHGVNHFGQTGTVADLYRHFKLDTNALVEAVINQSI